MSLVNKQHMTCKRKALKIPQIWRRSFLLNEWISDFFFEALIIRPQRRRTRRGESSKKKFHGRNLLACFTTLVKICRAVFSHEMKMYLKKKTSYLDAGMRVRIFPSTFILSHHLSYLISFALHFSRGWMINDSGRNR